MGQASHLFKEIEKRYENIIRTSLTQTLKKLSVILLLQPVLRHRRNDYILFCSPV